MSQLRQIQEEQIAWQQRNFPGRAPYMPLLGMVEEFSELWEACASVACTDDSPRGKDSQDVEDAIGDVLIFMCDYCTAMGINIEDIEAAAAAHSNVFKERDEVDVEYEFGEQRWLGRLCRSHLKFEQRIRGTPQKHMADVRDALARLVVTLQLCLESTEVMTPNDEIAQVAWNTWQVVKVRDWAKHRAEAEQVQP